MHAIPVLPDVLPLDIIEYVPDFVGRVPVVVQEGNKLRDRPFKVDIVLPECVIGIDEQVLAGRDLFQANFGHILYPIEL